MTAEHELELPMDQDTDEAGPDLDVPRTATTAPLAHTRSESVAAAVGSFMAGIEQQVFQRRPPAVELVHEATPVRGTTGDGLEITIEVPPLDPER